MNSPKSETTISYVNLKDKITDISGKLQEIKKDYELAKIEKKKKDKALCLATKDIGRTPSPNNFAEKENIKNLFNHADKSPQDTHTNLREKGRKNGHFNENYEHQNNEGEKNRNTRRRG